MDSIPDNFEDISANSNNFDNLYDINLKINLDIMQSLYGKDYEHFDYNNNNKHNTNSTYQNKETVEDSRDSINLTSNSEPNSTPKATPNNPNSKNSKRGREKNNSNENYQEHTKFNSDNCRIKIKSNFHNFIIDFFNILIKNNLRKQCYKFRKLSYDLSKNGSKKFNQSLLKKKIKEVLTMDISDKYKNFHPSKNQDTFYKFNKSEFLQKKTAYSDLLEMEYVEFYEKIYLPDNDKEFKEKYGIDKFSIKGEFHKIFNKKNINNEENSEYEKKIKNVAKSQFVKYFLSNKNLKSD